MNRFSDANYLFYWPRLTLPEQGGQEVNALRTLGQEDMGRLHQSIPSLRFRVLRWYVAWGFVSRLSFIGAPGRSFSFLLLPQVTRQCEKGSSEWTSWLWCLNIWIHHLMHWFISQWNPTRCLRMACLMARFICSSEVEIGFDCMPHEWKRGVKFLKVFGRQPEQRGEDGNHGDERHGRIDNRDLDKRFGHHYARDDRCQIPA